MLEPEDWTAQMQRSRQPFDRDEALRKAWAPEDVKAPAPRDPDGDAFPSIGNGPSNDVWTEAFKNRKLNR